MFADSAQLKLQDLTHDDIELYVRDMLQTMLGAGKIGTTDCVRKFQLIQKVIHKADGGFLWVYLATRTLFEGFTNEDGIEELEARLDQLPNEIIDLYTHMPQRVNTVYRRQIAVYFELMLSKHFKPLSALRMILAADQSMATGLFKAPFDESSRGKLILKCEGLNAIVATRCAGMLETEELSAEASTKVLIYYEEHSLVKALHRTVYGYFDTPEGEEFLKSNLAIHVEPHISHATSLLLLLSHVQCVLSSSQTATMGNMATKLLACTDWGLASRSFYNIRPLILVNLLLEEGGNPSLPFALKHLTLGINIETTAWRELLVAIWGYWSWSAIAGLKDHDFSRSLTQTCVQTLQAFLKRNANVKETIREVQSVLDGSRQIHFIYERSACLSYKISCTTCPILKHFTACSWIWGLDHIKQLRRLHWGRTVCTEMFRLSSR